MLFNQPFAAAAQLYPHAVYQQVNELALDCGRATSSVSARRLSVDWSGMVRSRPTTRMMEPINPSVYRRAERNTAGSVSAVAIAKAK